MVRFILFLLVPGWLAVAAASPVRAGDKVVVTKRDCLNLVRHRPAPDVAYTPGLDVHGRAVAPADLPSASPIQLPKEIVVDIGVDLNEKYGIGKDDDGNTRYTAETQTLGKVKVDVLSGRVMWNDRPLDGADTETLRAICRETYGIR